MQLEEIEVHDILTRLRRVEGQIRGIQGMLEEGRDCSDVITQFSASMRALEHAGYKYFAATVAMCATDRPCTSFRLAIGRPGVRQTTP
jgi:DNA-binding FrmR family transcriptional regulator